MPERAEGERHVSRTPGDEADGEEAGGKGLSRGVRAVHAYGMHAACIWYVYGMCEACILHVPSRLHVCCCVHIAKACPEALRFHSPMCSGRCCVRGSTYVAPLK